MVQLLHGDGIDHGDLAVVVLEDKYHVKVLQVELHALKMHQLQLLQCNQEEWLQAQAHHIWLPLDAVLR